MLGKKPGKLGFRPGKLHFRRANAPISFYSVKKYQPNGQEGDFLTLDDFPIIMFD